MIPDPITIEPLPADLPLWRCLHGGPLVPGDLATLPPGDCGGIPWPDVRARNLPLLTRLAAVYGATAIIARDGERIVGMLRFYPKAVASLPQAGGLCLQQREPFGPAPDLVDQPFPPLRDLADRTLLVHCLMTGCPAWKENPYQRRGLGTRLVEELLRWAGAEGWAAVEATAYVDLPLLYEITGQAGRRFWEKLGFTLVRTDAEPALLEDGPFTRQLRDQAAAHGLDPARIADKHIMRRSIQAGCH